MQQTLDRTVKSFCPYFASVRRVLYEIGAVFVKQTNQTDYFFYLPESSTAEQRLKLRYEDGEPRFAYYYDKRPGKDGTAWFQSFEVWEPVVKELLEAALGLRTTVHKRREVWRKDNIVFNLDAVRNVGQIFEVEIEFDGPCANHRPQQAPHYRKLFEPYLGADITESNEDLVGPA